MKLARLAKVFMTLALACVLAACGSHTITMELLDEVSGVKITAENAGKDQVASSEGAIDVEEGDVIGISPCMDKGAFHLTITSDDGETVVFDDDVDGRVMFQTAAVPGSYTVEVSGVNATGWMTVFAISADDLAEQDASLLEELEGLGVDTSTLSEEG